MNINFNRLFGDFERCKNKGKIAAWFSALLFIFYLFKEGSAYLRKLGENRSARKTYVTQRKADADLYTAKAVVDVDKAKALKNLRQNNESPSGDSKEPVHVDDAPSPEVVPFGELRHRVRRRIQWLIGDYVYVGGRCILFGPPSVGKSILSLQLAIAIAEGSEYGFLPPEEENSHAEQQVILFDFEMKAEEQLERIGDKTMPSNLFRCEDRISSFDQLFKTIEEVIQAPKVTVIIDNIRKLEEMSHGNQVTEYFNKLEQTQEKLKDKGITVTFITVTHTGKDFDKTSPVEMNDMAGGADLSRFSSSIIALAPARDGNVMFRAVKKRNSPETDEVYILRIAETPYLHFEYVCTSNVEDALPDKLKAKKRAKVAKASYATAEKPQKNAPNEKLSDDDVKYIRKEIEGATKDENDEKRKEELVKDLREKYAKQFGVNPITIKRRLDRLTANDDSHEDVDDQRA